MSEILTKLHQNIWTITLNRVEKHNSFDDGILLLLQKALEEGITHPEARVILLKANGRFFSAGADIAWMERIIALSEAENLEDAMVLARFLHTLHFCPKPTIAMVQGSAYGGGVGLIAACDIAIAAHSLYFCFSEIKLGLIPAVISPYVVKAIGERAAKHLFLSGATFDTEEAKSLQLIQYAVEKNELETFTLHYAEQIANLPTQGVKACKDLVDTVANKPIDENLIQHTARLIAKQRVSEIGQRGLRAFLNKEPPNWN